MNTIIIFFIDNILCIISFTTIIFNFTKFSFNFYYFII